MTADFGMRVVAPGPAADASPLAVYDSAAVGCARPLAADDGKLPKHLRRVLARFPDAERVVAKAGPLWRATNPASAGAFCHLYLHDWAGEPGRERVAFEFPLSRDDEQKFKDWERRLRDERVPSDERREIRRKRKEYQNALDAEDDEMIDKILAVVGLRRSDLNADADNALRLPEAPPERLEYVLRRLPYAVSAPGIRMMWRAPCPLHPGHADDLALAITLRKDASVDLECRLDDCDPGAIWEAFDALPPAPEIRRHPSQDRVRAIPLSAIQTTPTAFLWPDWLAYGQIATLAVQTTTAAITLTGDLIARTTTGRPMPGQDAGGRPRTSCS